MAAFATLLLCINSFAAIVSDNDGSAFITKAEFDSLKNSLYSSSLRQTGGGVLKLLETVTITQED